MILKSQQPDVVIPNENFGAYMLKRMREFGGRTAVVSF